MAELKNILSNLYSRIQAKQEKRQNFMERMANAFLNVALPDTKSLDAIRNACNKLEVVNSEILRDLVSIITFIGDLDEQTQSNPDVVWATSIVTKEKDLFENLKTKFFSKHVSMYADMAEIKKVLELREIVESVKKLNVLVGNAAILSKLKVRFEKEHESERYLLQDLVKAIAKAA